MMSPKPTNLQEENAKLLDYQRQQIFDQQQQQLQNQQYQQALSQDQKQFQEIQQQHQISLNIQTQQQKLAATTQTQNQKAQQNQQSTTETQTEIILDLERDNRFLSLTSHDLNAIGQMAVVDEVGNRHRLSELWADFKTIFIFTRSLLCFTTKEYVEDLALIPKDAFKQKQVRLVLICCANWVHIRTFRALTKFPYFIFSDVDCDIYKRLGFLKNKEYGKHGDSAHVKSGIMGGMMSSMFRAIKTSKLNDYQGDFDQQGGSLIVGPGPKFHMFHMDKHARDHCPINYLLKQVGMDEIDFKKEAKRKQNKI